MGTKYPLLSLMFDDMYEQSELYKPTSFWEFSSKLICEGLDEFGVENFRNTLRTRMFFVPAYDIIDFMSTEDMYNIVFQQFENITENKKFMIGLKNFCSGYSHIYSDYRVLVASDTNQSPFTDKVSESSVGTPLEQYTINNRVFSRSFMNYLLGLNFLKRNVDTSNISTVMEIGGGFGSLGEILLGDARNNIFYINADIPPVSYVSTYYLQKNFGKEKVADYKRLKHFEFLDIDTLKKQYRALNICSWQVPKLKGRIDLFVNFISFQEMEPEIVQNYCNYVDKLEPKYILLRNMLEGKRKQSETFKAGVIEPILGDDYNRFLPNYKLVAKDSAIFGFITEDNFHSELRIYERNIF